MNGFQVSMDAVSISCAQTTDGTAGRSTWVSMRFMTTPSVLLGADGAGGASGCWCCPSEVSAWVS